jgi:hypothetical protein
MVSRPFLLRLELRDALVESLSIPSAETQGLSLGLPAGLTYGGTEVPPLQSKGLFRASLVAAVPVCVGAITNCDEARDKDGGS